MICCFTGGINFRIAIATAPLLLFTDQQIVDLIHRQAILSHLFHLKMENPVGSLRCLPTDLPASIPSSIRRMRSIALSVSLKGQMAHCTLLSRVAVNCGA